MAEHEESVIVYLTQPTGGARIAAGSLDGGKRVLVNINLNNLLCVRNTFVFFTYTHCRSAHFMSVLQTCSYTF